MGEHPTVEQQEALRRAGWLIVTTGHGIHAKRSDHPELLTWREALEVDGERDTRESVRG